ncbi:MAG TPA: hypothetical protein DCS43_13790 [Verrucomicrobia bacterium]|nr:hypothetical protein [Verrucomicrobiota bacterium]
MPLRGRKVFVIEHSVFISSQIKGVLENAGVEVKSSQSPGKALLEIVHWHPDAIISSVDIGEITGFDLCLILKMMPDHAGIPFIILSSNESEQIRSQMASVGADYYIPKDSRIAINAYNTICDALHEADSSALAVPGKSIKHRGDHVLVVDDSAVMRRIICNILASLGVTKIVQAEHGEDVLKRLDEQVYGMVLTDWNMPIMNGLELTQAIRRRADTHKLPVIMITTEGAESERKAAEAAGVNELIPKPFARDHFRQVLQTFL